MHVLVCICSNVQQFHEIIGMIQMCYHTNHCACWPYFVNTRVFICRKTEKGTLMILSFTRVTLRVLALLGQVTWTGTVCFRGGKWGCWGGGGQHNSWCVGRPSFGSHPNPNNPLPSDEEEGTLLSGHDAEPSGMEDQGGGCVGWG